MNRKITALLMAALLCIICIATPAGAANTDDPTYVKNNSYVVTCSLTIRKKPSNSGAIVGYYKPGTPVVALSRKGAWTQTDKGYVCSYYLAQQKDGYMEAVLVNADTPAYMDINCKIKAGTFTAADVVCTTGARVKGSKGWMVPVQQGSMYRFLPLNRITYIDIAEPFTVKAKKETRLFSTPTTKKNGIKCRKGATLTAIGKVKGRYKIATDNGGTLSIVYGNAADFKKEV